MLKLIICTKDSIRHEVEVERFTFPDGTRHVRIAEDTVIETDDVAEIFATPRNSDELIDLLLLRDVLEDYLPRDVILFMPYMLGSRQDRRMMPGEPLSVKVYANMINAANFDEVVIIDPHSVAVSSLLDRVTVVPLSHFYQKVPIAYTNHCVVISPDAGALKRATKFANEQCIDTLIKADKTRDLASGRITAFDLYGKKEDIENRDVYIVDDICTNGGTFLGLLKVIKKMNPISVSLVVTHFDHPEGIARMAHNFDYVYTTNSRGSKLNSGIPNLAIVDIFD